MEGIRVDLLAFAILFFSCSENATFETHQYDAVSLKGIHVALERHLISELLEPFELFSVGNEVIVENFDKNGRFLYVYDSQDFSLKETFGTYGRAGNEYLEPGYLAGMARDSVFYLNVDVDKCAKFVIREGKIVELERSVNRTEGVTTAKRINNRQTLEANFVGERPFCIFDSNDGETRKRFGEFPDAGMTITAPEDVWNFFHCMPEISPDGKHMMVSYLSLPLIRLYSLDGLEETKRMSFVNVEPQVKDIESFYERGRVAYFYRAVGTGKWYYVYFVNQRGGDEFKGVSLLRFDWSGNLDSVYSIDHYCPFYTVTETDQFIGIGYEEDELYFYSAELK